CGPVGPEASGLACVPEVSHETRIKGTQLRSASAMDCTLRACPSHHFPVVEACYTDVCFRWESEPMQHLVKIRKLIEALLKSEKIHALVLQSAPGFAKSSTVERVLDEARIPFFAVGSYTTPLHLYHVLCEHPTGLVVLDDTMGLYSDPKAMAILKAALWSNVGSKKERRISWGSNSG